MTPVDLDALAAVMREATEGEWRAGTHQTWHVFVPHPEGLAGPGGERVLLRMNEHHPYVANVAAIVSLHNAWPALREELVRLRDTVHRLTRTPSDAEYALIRVEVVTHEHRHAIDCVVSATEAKHMAFPVADAIGSQLRRAANEVAMGIAALARLDAKGGA